MLILPQLSEGETILAAERNSSAGPGQGNAISAHHRVALWHQMWL